MSERADLAFWLLGTFEGASAVEVPVTAVAEGKVKGHASRERDFLVKRRSSFPVVEHSANGKYFSLSQAKNDGSAVLCPAGVYSESVVIAGNVSTLHTDADSRAIFRLFSGAIKSHSVSVRGNRVGPEALEILRRGGRLTWDIDSPPEFDLSEPGGERRDLPPSTPI